MPYGQSAYTGLKGILTGWYGRGLFRRLAGLRQALRLLPRMFGKG
jgi:hypothetical protein